MMNPKSFVDLYDDGLQAEEIENEKRRLPEAPEQGITQLWAHSKQILVGLWRFEMFNHQGNSQTSTKPYPKS